MNEGYPGKPEAIKGSWPEDCLQSAFVRGAQWWEFHKTGATMWVSDRIKAEAEAIRIYGTVDQGKNHLLGFALIGISGCIVGIGLCLLISILRGR